MKQFKKKSAILVMTSLVLYFMIPPGTLAYTLGTTSYGVEPGTVLVYNYSQATNPDYEGCKIRITVMEFFPFSFYAPPMTWYLRMNCTYEVYNKTTELWEYLTYFYEGYNASTGFLEISFGYIVPIHVNLTFLGEYYANNRSYIDGIGSGYNYTYTVNGSTLNLMRYHQTAYVLDEIATFKYTYDMNFGIATRIESSGNWTAMNHTLELETALYSGDAIPFGTSFLGFATLGILVLIVFVKRKSSIKSNTRIKNMEQN